jgi:periplasmic divalent cation tolerance protein
MTEEATLILCTAPNEEKGRELARGLVEAKLAACVNVIPGISSFYVWKGELQDDREVQLFIKTRPDLAERVEEWLGKHHPYDVPEILFIPIRGGSVAYLGWVRDQTI